jgi:hypothetical protein
MKIPRSLVVFVAVVLGSCGGGGGGSTSGGSGSGDGGGDGGGGGGSDDPSPNGTARIVFPLTPTSATTAPIATIRGIAADPEGVAGVWINGIAATMKATASSNRTLLSKLGSDEGEVEWSAEVELAVGENAVVISLEDESGEVTQDVDAATITYLEVPTTFTLDPDGARLVGLSYTLTPSGYEQHLVEHNYNTLEQRVFTGFSTSFDYNCFRRFEDDFIYLSFFTGTWELRRFNLATEHDSLIVEFGDAEWDPGAGFTPTPRVSGLVCSGNHTSAYVLANYTDENGAGHSGSAFAKSRVLEVDLASQVISILTETDTAAPSPRWIAEKIALAEDTIVAMRELNPVAPLTSISLADGTRTDLAAGVLVGGMALEPALNTGRVYVATFDGVDQIDVDTPSKQNISPVDDSNPLVFSAVRSIGFDPAGDRVIVGDGDLDTLIGIDIATGDRSIFLARSVGAGTPLIAPRRFALSADAAVAYVADDGSNAPARLLEIDMATGDRRVIGDISQPFNYIVSGLALDEADGRVFVSFHHLILEVDLETEEVQTIADIDSTDLESVNDLVLDIENNRLLVGDADSDGIFALDLTTHAVTVVSQESSQGAGPSFGGVVSLTRVPGSSQLYVAGQASETVTRVELETGDREALATTCDLGLSSTFQDLDQVLYGEGLGELIISGDKLYSLDLESAECMTLPRRTFQLQMQVTPTSEILGVSFGMMTQIDRETGEVVIISK